MGTFKTITEEQKQILIDEYINKNKGLLTSAKAAGIGSKLAKRILTEEGYKIRNKAEANQANAKDRGMLGNHEYFSLNNQNSNMAWLLGFLAADGCIEKDRNVIKLSLSSIDREILEKIRNEISLRAEVKDYITTAGYNVSKLQWSSAQHKKDLSLYGVIPQKTFSLKPPYQLDRKYWGDYIRGYWDGDGSITLNKNNYNSLSWQITSATKEILEFIIDYFYEEYSIPKVKVHSFQRNGNTLYILQYSTQASIEICKQFYKNKGICLQRKKEHFQSVVNLKI